MDRTSDTHPRYLRGLDWIGVLAMLGLMAIGVAFVWSTTHHNADYRGSSSRQAIYLLASLVLFAILLLINYRTIQQYAFLIFLGGLGLLLLTYTPLGVTLNFSTRWVGLGPFRIQPSEFMKIAFVIGLARYLMYRKNYRRLGGLIPPFVITFIPLILVLRQPDLGTSLIFLPVLFAMLYAAGAKTKHLVTIIVLGAISIPLVLWPFVMSDHQKERVLGHWDPERYMESKTVQPLVAEEAIRRGGVWGSGLGEGLVNKREKLYASESDFIYAVVAEEWGFMGGVAVIGLFTLLMVTAVRVALRTREPFGRLVVIGLGALIAFQAVTNIGIALRILPTTGLTLPFVSKGGSSLMAMTMAVAIVLNVGMHREPSFARDDFDFREEE